MEMQPGQKALNFTLIDTEKNKVSLEDYRGKNVVLLFFPAAFTGVCTKELCTVRDDLSFFTGLNAQVLAISVDSLFTLGKFKELNNINFPVLSDFNKEVSASYGVLYDEWVHGMKGVAKRSSFVLDKDGVIRYMEILENAGDFPNIGAIKNALSSLKEAELS